MADTARGYYPDIPCSDCGDEELGQVYIKHWGSLVPPGKIGFFGPKCWEARVKDGGAGRPPRELGTKAPEEMKA